MKSSKNLQNRRAHYDYDLKEKIWAGIALKGNEVVNLRQQRVSLKGAFVEIKDDQVWLKNLQIFPHQTTAQTADAAESHRLLLTKKQIKNWQKQLLSGKGNTIVPLQIKISGRYIKIEIALALGRKKYDKREVLRKRSDELRIKRETKNLKFKKLK